MSAVFAGTSALLALLNPKDDHHAEADNAFATLRVRQAPLISTSYVLVETYALVGRRLGIEAVRRFRTEFVPLLEVVWVGAVLHDAGLDLLLERNKRLLSLVDALSFVTMRRRNLEEAFAFDPQFEEEGFTLLG